MACFFRSRGLVASIDCKGDGLTAGSLAIAYTRYPWMNIKIVGPAPQVLHRDHFASARMVTDGNAMKQSIQ
ncbi:hypothetical protein [Oricola sp.]|uniref:hypothetical protein n=1 Tax=Oricola sp. TaxID=1979950 RepID=UPI0025E4FA0B|nr:hypothetical protein [Oricola sp.]MCI5076421.1 hypothetical protein [Oricola sp.]